MKQNFAKTTHNELEEKNGGGTNAVIHCITAMLKKASDEQLCIIYYFIRAMLKPAAQE